jgi:ADP-ribose pyrophosphatase YjhB (NUDIX family)
VTNQQPIVEDSRGRRFAMSAAAVLAFIINEEREILMLKHPQRDGWEIVNGALDEEETVLEGVLREISEEAGPDLKVRPLGTIHTHTFRYDDRIQYMISISYLLAYESGAAVAGHDMADSEVRWVSLSDIKDGTIKVVVPGEMAWLFRRAVELYDLWYDRPDELLQPVFDINHTNKHGY